MAQKRIEAQDLINPKALESIISDAKQLESELTKILETNKQLLKNNPFKTGKDVSEFKNTVNAANEAQKAYSATQRKRIKLQNELERLRKGELDDVTALNETVKQARKDTRERIKEERGLLSEYQKKTKRLREIKQELKESIIVNGKSAKSTRKLAREFRSLDREVRDAEEAVGEFQRNVGNYPRLMGKAASAILGVAGAITAATTAAAGFKGSLDANEEGSEKLTGVLGFLDGALDEVKNIAGGAASSLIDLGEALFFNDRGKFSKSFDQLTKSFDDAGKKIFEAGKVGKDAAEELRQLTKDNRDLERALDQVNGQLAKQQAIAGDQTKSFNEIEAATERAANLEVRRAEIQEQINQKELDRINKLIEEKQKLGQNVESLLDDQLAAELAYSQAKTEIDLSLIELDKIRRENARDRFERELDFAIDAFDSQKSVNERLVADETKTFKERVDIFQRTAELSEKAFNEQQKLVEDFTGERLRLNELVNIDDEALIRERLRRFEIDDVTLGRVLEIIREQKIARQDLADLERDLNVEAKDRAEEQITILNDLEQAQIQGRINELEDVEGKESEIFELRKRALIDQAEFEISLEDATAEEIELIRQRLNNDLADLEREEKRRKEDARKEEINAEIDKFNEIKDLAFDVFDRIGQRQQRQLDFEISNQSERIDRQQRLAERGLANTLAFEEEKAARLEAKREELAKKAERRQKTLAYLTAFTEYLKQDPNSAAGKALAQVALAETISGAFYEGTENVADSIGSPIFSGRDGYVIRVDGQERVMTGMQNKKIGGLTNDQLADLAQAYNRGDVISKSGNGLSDSGLKRIEDAVKSINIHVDAEGFITREEFERGMKKITKTKPRRL